MNGHSDVAHVLAPPRYVSRDRLVFDFSHCKLCGACYGICAGEPAACRVAICLACGTEQCSVNGLSRGQCAVCYSGLLEGWSGSGAGQACSYKDCPNSAVARGRGRKLVCREHLIRQQPGWESSWREWRDAHFILTEAVRVPLLGGAR